MSATVGIEQAAWTPHRNQDCVHVVCAGGACLYRPEVPTIGPELPVTIRDAAGQLWVRSHAPDSMVYYADHGRKGVITWCGIHSGFEVAWGKFAAGPWSVEFAGDWF